jgi:hypothetical protein
VWAFGDAAGCWDCLTCCVAGVYLRRMTSIDVEYERRVHVVLSSPAPGDPLIVVHGPHMGTQGRMEGVERNRVALVTEDGWRVWVPRPMVVVDRDRLGEPAVQARVAILVP